MRLQMARIERVARRMNVWLLVIAVGLAFVDLTVLVVKATASMPGAH